jgi:hypothetical protein
LSPVRRDLETSTAATRQCGEMTKDLETTFANQDQLIARRQALYFLSEDELATRLGKTWRVVLPGVYSSSTAPVTQRQRLRVALLHAGPGSMLNDHTALAVLRVPHLPADPLVRVLVSREVQRSSRDFVVTRRTTRLPAPTVIDNLPVVPVHRALCEFMARHPDERESLAVAAAAVQLGRTTVERLANEIELGPARGRPRALRVLAPLQLGVRSAPEDDFRQLVGRSRVLPTPLWNPLLQLPDGSILSPDALFVDAALVHETNGRQYHAPEEAGEDVFEDMQRRHDRLVAAGFTVLHNSPRRLQREGDEVLGEVEACHARAVGHGLPLGVSIVRSGPGGIPRNVTSHGKLAS